MRPAQPARIRSSLSAKGKRFVIVASRFHPPLARSLIRGATSVLRRSGASSSSVRLLWVPGAFELPVVAARAARSHPHPDAIVALGALIRGDTPQYEILAYAVTHGLTQVAVTTGVPVTCGLIVAETPAQAHARAGGAMGNRGEEAARAALDVLHLFETLETQ